MPQPRRRSPNPLVISRERVQEVLDDAVERGRMTRDDAAELFAELARRGRGGLVGTARRATGLGPAFPIAGYEDLTAAQVAERLDGLTVAENVFLGHELASGGFTRRRELHARTRALLQRLGHSDIPPHQQVPVDVVPDGVVQRLADLPGLLAGW